MIIDENKKAGSGLYFTVQLKFVVAFIGACF
jgi:poly-beta-1,6-N-acetyl-D-glucosamine synthase